VSKLTIKTKIAKNICRVVFKPPPPKFNELFLPRRMAYVMDLEDEETDIPITLMRSKAECPTQEVSNLINAAH
jgi:IK cytokine